MNSDFSFETTIEHLEQKREQLLGAILNEAPPLSPHIWMDKALSLLDETQFAHASSYFVFDLPRIVMNDALGEWADLGEWLDQLNPAQQEQVIEFYNARLLDDYGLVLTWYDNYGLKGGYRFEIAPHPVASR